MTDYIPDWTEQDGPYENTAPSKEDGRLPIVNIFGVQYFVDIHLGQIRAVDNPHDYENLPRDVLQDLLDQGGTP